VAFCRLHKQLRLLLLPQAIEVGLLGAEVCCNTVASFQLACELAVVGDSQSACVSRGRANRAPTQQVHICSAKALCCFGNIASHLNSSRVEPTCDPEHRKLRYHMCARVNRGTRCRTVRRLRCEKHGGLISLRAAPATEKDGQPVALADRSRTDSTATAHSHSESKSKQRHKNAVGYAIRCIYSPVRAVQQVSALKNTASADHSCRSEGAGIAVKQNRVLASAIWYQVDAMHHYPHLGELLAQWR
jgi:hypothetical protein